MLMRYAIPHVECDRYYLYMRHEMQHTDWSHDRILAEITARCIPCLSAKGLSAYMKTGEAHAGRA